MRELRKATGMTLKAFSELLHIPYRTVQDWEREERVPASYTVDLIEYFLKKEGYINNAFEDVQPVNQWISCKDKMPEDNTLVLFVYVSENGVKSVHYGYHQTLKGLGSSWAKPSGGWHYYDDDITHWQPLPEPPKDGDAND